MIILSRTVEGKKNAETICRKLKYPFGKFNDKAEGGALTPKADDFPRQRGEP
jgi:hypothetical protein